MIIAIDGPAASGKSTTAQKVAEKLGFTYMDTGAMYRAVTLSIILEGIDPEDSRRLQKLLDKFFLDLKWENGLLTVFLNGKDVTDDIRSVEVTKRVSAVSSLPKVREKMVAIQRSLGSRTDCVIEGRDIGTVVFPNADWKFYITADYKSRAQRRQRDLRALGENQSIDQMIENLKVRDEKDSSRSLSPLKRAVDAIEIDTTHLTIDEQIKLIVNKIRQNKH
ncbi:MAG: (d)CMP kinase [Candidatus Neomarinimicrobiota bacterium]